MKPSLPITLYNAGSKEAHNLDFSRAVLWARMSPGMGRKAVTIPVYIVNPDQIDYLYPPHRKRFLNPKQVARWAELKRAQMREGQRGEPLLGLDPSSDEMYIQTVVVGLYRKREFEPKEWEEVLARADSGATLDVGVQAIPEVPVILLCAERILGRAARESVDPQLVLDKVYYHELGHALMDTGHTPYKELWGRIVEESLANWIATRRFWGVERLQVKKLIAGQPAEYQGYASLAEAFLTLSDLRGFWRQWRYLWRESHWYREWEHWEEYAARRGWPSSLLRPWRFAAQRRDEISRWVYEAWREAKRSNIGGDFWAAYAENILLETFA